MSIRKQAANIRKGDDIPEGWKTAMELAKEEQVSRVTMAIYLKDLIAAGKWEVKIFYTIDVTGRRRQTPYYREVASD